MMDRHHLLKMALVVTCFVALASASRANLWVEENFDVGVAWDHAASNATGGALDAFAASGLDGSGNPTVTIDTTAVSDTGAVSADCGFASANSYKMDAGQGFELDAGDDPTNGGLHIVQLCVGVANVPAGAGTVMGRLDLPFTFDDTAHNIYVEVVSDGAGGADLVGGEDVAINQSGMLLSSMSTDEWIVLTIVITSDGLPQSDSRLGFSMDALGIQFYAASAAPQLELTPNDPEYGAGIGSARLTGNLSVGVSNGTVYVDAVHLESDLNNAPDNEAQAPLKKVEVPIGLSEFELD